MRPKIKIKCTHCGHKGEADFAGGAICIGDDIFSIYGNHHCSDGEMGTFIESDVCRYFEPNGRDQQMCRWWLIPSEGTPVTWLPFCCHSKRLGISRCPTEGQNPYPNEEDSFE